MSASEQTWLPDLTFTDGAFQPRGLVTNNGRIERIAPAAELGDAYQLRNRAVLPGLVNAHSHAFQRVIRGRTEYRSQVSNDSFWTWRELMYSAAARLTPEDVYDAARMAFLEMALSGITTVGEFHYLHSAPDGSPYEDPNLLAKEVVRAAGDIGLRIALLRVAYARAGFQTEPNPRQSRFFETSPDIYLRNFEKLTSDLVNSDGSVWTGIAPHSVRAVPLPYLKELVGYANNNQLPVHMHVAEQPAEVSACIAEYGRSPVALLDTEGFLSERFTAVHAIHITEKAVTALADASAIVCACPTTERNLGDGVVPADLLFKQGVRVSLGSDSHTQIDLLEDARELEYHLRLQKLERVILADRRDDHSALAGRLFSCATIAGAESLGFSGGKLENSSPADFFTVDLTDPSLAGASAKDLISNVVFSLSKTAVRDVVVSGKRIVENGRHAAQDEIVERFNKLQKKLWNA